MAHQIYTAGAATDWYGSCLSFPRSVPTTRQGNWPSSGVAPTLPPWGWGLPPPLPFEPRVARVRSEVSVPEFPCPKKKPITAFTKLGGPILARLVLVSNRVSVPSGDGARRAGGLESRVAPGIGT